MIRAVLFDVDGVLLNSFEANFRFYQELFKKAGYTPPTLQEYIPFMHGTLDMVIRGVTNASDEEVQRVWKMGKSFVERFYPYDLLKTPKHVTATLQKLHNTYQLGIVTSRLKGSIYTMPPLLPLKKYFQVTVGFEDTTAHKPNPEPLLFASNKLGISPADIVYIGDAESDITAGKSAGMKVILFAERNFAQAASFTQDFSKIPVLIRELH